MANPIINVPLKTALFDGTGDPDGPALVKKLGNINREWAIFFASESGWLTYGVHSDRAGVSAGSVPDGGLFVETDRAALYEARSVNRAQAWVLVMARLSGLYGQRPNDLGIHDAGFEYNATDALDYRWNGMTWSTVDTARGGTALVDVNRIPKITAAGTLGESAVSDDGTNVEITRTIAGAVQPTLVIDSGISAKGRLGRATNTARVDFGLNLSYDGTNWNLDDTSKNGTLVVLDPAAVYIYSFAAGANPATARQTAIATIAANGDVTAGANVIATTNVQAVDVEMSGVLKKGGLQVVGARGLALTASGAAVGTTAGATYPGSAQATINSLVTLANNLKTRVDELEARLAVNGGSGHGLFS